MPEYDEEMAHSKIILKDISAKLENTCNQIVKMMKKQDIIMEKFI